MVEDMKKGYGTPLVKIMNLKGQVILDRFGNAIGRFVHDFKYKYDQEHGDSCEITFKTDDPFFADGPFFRRQASLLVKWGYITSTNNTQELGPTRTITINDISCPYTQDGIKLTLTCGPYTEFLKKVSGATKPTTSFLDFIDAIAQGKFRWRISRGGQAIYTTGKTPAYHDPKTGQLVEARDEAAKELKLWMEDFHVYVTAGRNPYTVLKNKLQYAPGGPYTAEMRDDGLEIKEKYNFNQKPIRYYVYKGGSGELLSFEPKSEDSLPDIVSMQSHSMDPLKKEVKTLQSVVSEKPKDTSGDNTGNYKKSDGDSDRDNGDPQFWDKGYYAYKGPNGATMQEMEHNFINSTYKDYFDKYYAGTSEDGTILLKEGAPNPPNLAIDLNHFARVNTYGPQAQLYLGLDRNFNVGMTVVPMAVIMNTQAEEVKIPVENALKDAFYRKYTADVEIIGDPFIESDKVIYISGVARVHRGRYYVLKACHKISPEGVYTVSMDLNMAPQETESLNHSVVSIITETDKTYRVIEKYKTKVVEDLDGDGELSIEDIKLEVNKKYNTPAKPVVTPEEDFMNKKDNPLNFKEGEFQSIINKAQKQ